MNNSNGALENISSIGGIDNPSFLALSPDNTHLYAVSEVGKYHGRPAGAVFSYSISQNSGLLTYVNQQSTLGPGPCHLAVDATGKHLVVANYQGGSVCVLPINADGSLGSASAFIQHQGSSVDPNRQTQPHAHSVNLDPNNRFVYVPDLGMDKVMIYRLDHTSGNLIVNNPGFVEVEPGSGPRHFAFHPKAKYAYVLNEIGNTIIGFRWDADDGSLTELQTITTLPSEYCGTSHTADMHIEPNGRFLYCSNRGHNSITMFAIDKQNGYLRKLGHVSTRGKTPRNIALDPSGRFMYAENQDSDTIVTFAIDNVSGSLNATGNVVNIPMPVCIKFIT